MSDPNAVPEFDESRKLDARGAFIAVGFVEARNGLFGKRLPYSTSPYLRALVLILHTFHLTDFYATPRDLSMCRAEWQRKGGA